MHNPDNFLPDDAEDDLETLLRLSVGKIVRNENPEEFIHWFRNSAAVIAPSFFRQFPKDADMLRSFLTMFGREIWNRTPLPGNRFRPRALPKPERNAPCVCGSGRKYKQCCAVVETGDSPFEHLSLLSYVLDSISAEQRKTLPYAYLNPEELAFVSRQWMEDGRAKDAVKLLEGLFADFARLDDRAEAAFDCLPLSSSSCTNHCRRQYGPAFAGLFPPTLRRKCTLNNINKLRAVTNVMRARLLRR